MQCITTCGPRRSTGDFGRRTISKIVSETEKMKNTPIHVCAKTAFITLTAGTFLSYSLACTFGCCEYYEYSACAPMAY
jgi:hypothetical protein